MILTVVGGVKAADVTDAADPLVHLFFGVGYQVEDAVDSLDVEDVAVLQVLLAERQAGIHLKGQQRWRQITRKVSCLQTQKVALARLSACSDCASLLTSYLLTQVEINHAYRLLGIVIFVVLQHVRVARQTTAAKNKPPLLPCLWG